MTAGNVATESEESEKQAPLALPHPRIAGSGSSRVFSNPWPEWQVRVCIKAVITVLSCDRSLKL